MSVRGGKVVDMAGSPRQKYYSLCSWDVRVQTLAVVPTGTTRLADDRKVEAAAENLSKDRNHARS